MRVYQTYIGPILVAANPYKMLSYFTASDLHKYATAPVGAANPPHIYELAQNALRSMIDFKTGQSVVIRCGGTTV